MTKEELIEMLETLPAKTEIVFEQVDNAEQTEPHEMYLEEDMTCNDEQGWAMLNFRYCKVPE